MKNYEAEILVQDVGEFNERIFLNGHIYVCDKGRSDALYFAPYFTGKKESEQKGIRHISRVLYIEEIGLALNSENEERIKNYFSVKFEKKEAKNWTYWKNGLDMTFKRKDISKLARFYFLDSPIGFITETPISKNDIKACGLEKGIGPMISKNYSLNFSDLLKIFNAKGKKE